MVDAKWSSKAPWGTDFKLPPRTGVIYFLKSGSVCGNWTRLGGDFMLFVFIQMIS